MSVWRGLSAARLAKGMAAHRVMQTKARKTFYSSHCTRNAGHAQRATPLVTIDVRERPELARKYGVAIVPTVVAVGPDGRVLERLAP